MMPRSSIRRWTHATHTAATSSSKRMVKANPRIVVALVGNDLTWQADLGTERHDPASRIRDTGSFEKRVKGVEPSTFTLATHPHHIVKNRTLQHLRHQATRRAAPAQRNRR